MTFDTFKSRIITTEGHAKKQRPFFIIGKKKYFVIVTVEKQLILAEYDIPSTGMSCFYWDNSINHEAGDSGYISFQDWYNTTIKEEHLHILEKYIFELTM